MRNTGSLVVCMFSKNKENINRFPNMENSVISFYVIFSFLRRRDF